MNKDISSEDLRCKKERIKREMIKIYEENAGFCRLDLPTVAKAHKKWLSLKEEARLLREKDLDVNIKFQNNVNRVFVNSYGEATKREITTTTYKKAQKRQEKLVLKNMGIYD